MFLKLWGLTVLAQLFKSRHRKQEALQMLSYRINSRTAIKLVPESGKNMMYTLAVENNFISFCKSSFAQLKQVALAAVRKCT